MPITTMTAMWSLLQAYTLTPSREQRPVNHNNEWGGFSTKVGTPVFTSWKDLTTYDKAKKTTTALVSDTTWTSAVGVNNQEFWLTYAEQKHEGIAAFFIIHAADENVVPRKVKYIDAESVFSGKIVRDGTKTYIVGQRRPL